MRAQGATLPAVHAPVVHPAQVALIADGRAAEPPAALARVKLGPPEPVTAPEVVRGTTAPVRRVDQESQRRRHGPTGSVAQRADMRTVLHAPGRTTVARRDPVSIVPVARARTALQTVVAGLARMVRLSVLAARARTALRTVLVGLARTALRTVLVGLARTALRTVLAGPVQLAGSGVTRVPTRVSSVHAVPVPSALRRAALVDRCRLPISGQSLSRTSGGRSPSAWRRHRRRGSASNG